MQAIICPTMAEFDIVNARIKAYLAEWFGSQMDKWSSPLIHPSDGRIACQVEDRVLSALTDGMKSRIETLTDDWFPAAPVEG